VPVRAAGGRRRLARQSRRRILFPERFRPASSAQIKHGGNRAATFVLGFNQQPVRGAPLPPEPVRLFPLHSPPEFDPRPASPGRRSALVARRAGWSRRPTPASSTWQHMLEWALATARLPPGQRRWGEVERGGARQVLAPRLSPPRFPEITVYQPDRPDSGSYNDPFYEGVGVNCGWKAAGTANTGFPIASRRILEQYNGPVPTRARRAGGMRLKPEKPGMTIGEQNIAEVTAPSDRESSSTRAPKPGS